MIDWFELRQNILIDISNTGNDVYSIYIKNNNESKVDDIHIVTSKNILDSESNTPFPEGVKKLESNKINIKSLAPAEEMTLKIRF